jgi:hypothetical protein
MYQGDIILDHVQQIPASGGPRPASVGIAYAQYLWPKIGSVYEVAYTIDPASGDLTNLNGAISQRRFHGHALRIKSMPRNAGRRRQVHVQRNLHAQRDGRYYGSRNGDAQRAVRSSRNQADRHRPVGKGRQARAAAEEAPKRGSERRIGQ